MAFASPDLIVNDLSLDEGHHVADFGAGGGAYAVPIARRVGSAGRVYAIDVQKELLGRLKQSALHEGVGNVEILWGDIESPNGSKLAPHSMDRVLVSNVLFQAEDKERVAKEASRILKPSGMALVIDWTASHGGLGPTEGHVVKAADARRLFLNNGFAEVREVPAGDFHYGILFRKL